MEDKKIGIPLEGFGEAVRKAAAEGMVLLKNENQMLPITEKDQVALFGRCQMNYYKSGTGSGGAVNTAYTTNLIDGFRRYKNIVLNEELLKVYEAWIQEHPFDDGQGAWASEPWFQKEMPVSLELAKKARETSNKALVVIGRTAGEDKDYAAVEGSYYLTKEEKQLLETVAEVFEDTCVIMNVSNIIDMSWLETLKNKEHIRSVIYTTTNDIGSRTPRHGAFRIHRESIDDFVRAQVVVSIEQQGIVVFQRIARRQNSVAVGDTVRPAGGTGINLSIEVEACQQGVSS